MSWRDRPKAEGRTRFFSAPLSVRPGGRLGPRWATGAGRSWGSEGRAPWGPAGGAVAG